MNKIKYLKLGVELTGQVSKYWNEHVQMDNMLSY